MVQVKFPGVLDRVKAIVTDSVVILLFIIIATYTFSFFDNVPDNKRVIIGWMSNWDYAQQVPTFAWRGSNTIAREIKLVKKGNAYSLVSHPVKEINKYISKTIKEKSVKGKGKLDL
ncbi:MAG: hypothetical protein Q8T08_22055, partial [Ignavibacteria bacterium]|nr:hypothetical protein [Ignavibacteria bacterium]